MQTWTIKKILHWSIDYFRQKGIETARLDAEILLAYALHFKRLDLYLQYERPLDKAELASYKSLIQRRAGGEPVAYIVGKKEFWSRDFFVDTNTLIPRPDTETLIEVLLDHYKGNTSSLLGFEMGLGSGVISVTLLAEIERLNICAVEISAAAMAVARKNAVLHGVAERLKIIAGDFLTLADQVDFQSQQYDFVCANPPYCRSDLIDRLDTSVKDHEPHLALDGGERGLKYYPALLGFARRNLKSDGLLVVEIGEEQGPQVSQMFADGGLDQIKVKKDFNGLDRVVSGKQP